MKLKYYFFILLFTLGFNLVLNFQELKFSTINDIEGNIYKTVLLNEQEWMLEDLKTDLFNNNEELEFVQDPILWSKMENSAICKDSIFNNHSQRACNLIKIINY